MKKQTNYLVYHGNSYDLQRLSCDSYASKVTAKYFYARACSAAKVCHLVKEVNYFDTTGKLVNRETSYLDSYFKGRK